MEANENEFPTRENESVFESNRICNVEKSKQKEYLVAREKESTENGFSKSIPMVGLESANVPQEGTTKEKSFFESAFANHRFTRDVEELTLCRNSTFLPHANVSFHLQPKNFKKDESKQAQKGVPRKRIHLYELSSILCEIEVREGVYKDVLLEFLLDIPSAYPFRAPTIRSLDPIFHPNIDLKTGKVALKILTHDWSPVLTLRTLVLSLVLLFVEPNMDFVYNQEAAVLYNSQHEAFVQAVSENLEYITEIRAKKESIRNRRKKRAAAVSSNPSFQTQQRPSQRVHYNPSHSKPCLAGKRQSETMTKESNKTSTHLLMEKLHSWQLGNDAKRRKFFFNNE